MVDTNRSIIDYIWTLLTSDSDLQTEMGGTVRCYLTWAPADATFPYLVHRLDIEKTPGAYPVQRGTYYLDIWSDSTQASQTLAIRALLIGLIDELVFNTDDVSLVRIEFQTDGFIPEPEEGIWHYATMWNVIFRRDTEATAIEGR